MFIDKITGARGNPAYLLRRAYRDENGKPQKETLANLSCLPEEALEILSKVLKGTKMIPANNLFEIVKSRPHGHVQAVLEAMNHLEISKLLEPIPSKERSLVVLMIAARILRPNSKLATTQWLDSNSLADEIGIEVSSEDELYKAMDWLWKRKKRIENALAKRHLNPDCKAYVDMSSSYYEGKTCPLIEFGYSRDRKRGKKQINYSLLTDAVGRPISIEIYKGNITDSNVFLPMVDRIKNQFKISDVCMVGDRGMLTEKNINILRAKEGIDWITALKSTSIRGLTQLREYLESPFDEYDLCEFEIPDEFPGDRLIVCRNPALRIRRREIRDELLGETDADLNKIKARVEKGKLIGKDAIGYAIGKIICKHKMQKHFILEIGETSFSYKRNQENIDLEMILDGIYVVITSLPKDEISAEECVTQYKNLAKVERAFRTMKMIGLKIRPIYHRTEDKVRAHFFLVMLSYYVEWHMREVWHELTYADEIKPEKENPVDVYEKSREASAKCQTKKNKDNFPTRDFRGVLDKLSTITKNTCIFTENFKTKTAIDFKNLPRIEKYTEPGDYERKALELIDSIKICSHDKK
jgi:transposase